MVLENCGAGINHHERSISMHTAVTEHHMETEPSWNITELYVFWLITCVIFHFKQSPSSLYTINHHQYDNIYTSCKIAIIKWFTFTICCYHQLPLSLSLPAFHSCAQLVWRFSYFPQHLKVPHLRGARSAWILHTQTHTHIWCEVWKSASLSLCDFFTRFRPRGVIFFIIIFFIYLYFFFIPSTQNVDSCVWGPGATVRVEGKVNNRGGKKGQETLE